MGQTGTKTTGRTTVLLGAGASRDAGLRLTSELAAAVVAKANAEHSPFGDKPGWVRALNAVYAGMIGYQGASGQDPLSAVNIETLISAVRLLRSRDKHEVAPFVAAWSPALTNFGLGTLPNSYGRTIIKEISDSRNSRIDFADRNITEAVAGIARAALQPDLKQPFAEAEEFILRTLVELLGAHRDVSYLDPLLELAKTQQGGLDVITLNYDLTVESAAANRDVPVNRGIDTWNPGEYLQFPSVAGTLNLMKLHGSLDWRVKPQDSELGDQLSPRGIDVVDTENLYASPRRSSQDLPWIVVGDREKLATDGPTLVLNFAARDALMRTDRVVVVGYSFGDAHINAMLRDWLARDPSRTLVILDVSFPRARHISARDGFRSALIETYGFHHDPFRQRHQYQVFPIEGTAAASLTHALSPQADSIPSVLAEVQVVRIEDGARIEVKWLGNPLSSARLMIRSSSDANDPYEQHSIVLSQEPYPASEVAGKRLTGALDYDEWPTGLARSAYLLGSLGPSISVVVDGHSISGLQEWTTHLDVP
ncbi:SIR2 family protein [Curtobacterium sp. MCBD17_023]|uniref:SIR2 family protein n=1 Tax=Curtobacterium sp. MCBD17_023 TaxID=2175657 RepID=UPI000D906E91|nr:SIR2 family protein [Curtobacterium sp. MCBD17_023]PYY46234.1 hypothetical protein DEI84_12965 [Curtobacterium sp. MCBD17_023]